MADIKASAVEESTLDAALDTAAGGLADSITRGLTRRPWMMALCLIAWAVTAPAQFLWNAI